MGEFVKSRQEHTDRQLQENEEHYHALVDGIKDYAIFMIDPDGRVLSWNHGAERIKGYRADEILHKSIESFYMQEDRAAGKVAALLQTAAREGRAEDEGWRLRKDGSRFWANVVITALRNENGELRGFAKITRDVTERKQHAEELEKMRLQAEEANRLKSDFLANMSHELRTPLNSVIGFSELIHDGKAGPVTADQKEYLSDVLGSAHHLLQLINDILDLAKIEAGKIRFRPESVALDALTHEVCGSLRTISSDKKIHVTVEILPGLEAVEADAGRLKQVLYNYLSNALKFTPEGGHVRVQAKPEGNNFYHLSVQDDGVGIPLEDQNRLFVAFQQLDASSAKKFQGTGLGLALTKKIVEAQGGRVGVDSAPGKGAVFYAVLPRKPL